MVNLSGKVPESDRPSGISGYTDWSLLEHQGVNRPPASEELPPDTTEEQSSQDSTQQTKGEQ
jgi:hypothetical protein